MAYLVPYFLTLALDQRMPLLTCIAHDDPGVPDDHYILEDWYCPNPECACQDVFFNVRSQQHRHLVCRVRWNLDPAKHERPVLADSDDPAPYAADLLRTLAPQLMEDPAWRELCRDHFRQLRAVAANPAHPAYRTVMDWATNENPKFPGAKKHRRRRRNSEAPAHP
jgi:hypothetical protein